MKETSGTGKKRVILMKCGVNAGDMDRATVWTSEATCLDCLGLR